MKIDRRETLQERYEKLPENIKKYSPIKTLATEEIEFPSAQDNLYLTENSLYVIMNQLNYITERLYGEKLINVGEYIPSHKGIEHTSRILANTSLNVAQKLFELEKLI